MVWTLTTKIQLTKVQPALTTITTNIINIFFLLYCFFNLVYFYLFLCIFFFILFSWCTLELDRTDRPKRSVMVLEPVITSYCGWVSECVSVVRQKWGKGQKQNAGSFLLIFFGGDFCNVKPSVLKWWSVLVVLCWILCGFWFNCQVASCKIFFCSDWCSWTMDNQTKEAFFCFNFFKRCPTTIFVVVIY